MLGETNTFMPSQVYDLSVFIAICLFLTKGTSAFLCQSYYPSGVGMSPVNSKEVVFQPKGYMTSKFILIQLIVRGECLVLTKRLV